MTDPEIGVTTRAKKRNRQAQQLDVIEEELDQSTSDQTNIEEEDEEDDCQLINTFKPKLKVTFEDEAEDIKDINITSSLPQAPKVMVTFPKADNAIVDLKIQK